MLLVAGGLLGLFWLGFARLVSTKDQWKKEKAKNFEMVWFGVGLFILAVVVAALMG